MGARSLTFITGLCLILFLGSMTLFYYSMASVGMDRLTKELWKNSTFAFGITYVFIFECIGIRSFFQKQFITVSKIVLLLTYIIIILTYSLIMAKPYLYLITLDSGTLLAMIIILTSYGRHGYLNDEL